MFDSLREKILSPIRSLGKSGRITEADLEEALKDIRRALLEADVHFKVSKEFLEQVRREAVGQELLKSVTPGQQFTKIVYDALVRFLGGAGEDARLELRAAPPVPILLVGLQGSGKTTTAAKLALYLKKKEKKRVLLVPCDPRRPAAKEQLRTLARQAEVECFDSDLTRSPARIVKAALEEARSKVFDALIVDTAGRLAIDEELMDEIQEVKKALQPHATLFVADSMTGQDAVNVAQAFHARTPLSGVILTKLDGDARGGAALSIQFLTGLPIFFFGTGEGVAALEPFHADRLASRILDRGDVLTLVEKAQEAISEDEAKAGIQKMAKGQFSLEDFLGQMKMMQKLGSMESLMKMLPGGNQLLGQLKGVDAEKELKRTEAIILSMTSKERRNHKVLNGSRRLRIAKGSGTSVAEVNRVVQRFEQTQKMMAQFSKMGLLKKMLPF
ncbi:MAG: signal recognition particle protein [Bdellovibrionales bacterium]|nr:signal recognition particle protein [Bdellovibrionales bacterium]